MKTIGFLTCLLFATTLAAQSDDNRLDLDNPPSGYMVWKSDYGTNRVWTGAQYILVDDQGYTIMELPQFQYVDDYKEGVAIVKTKFNKCGFLNLQGKIVIHPKWLECRASSGGYVTVKDRYEDLYLVKNTGEQVMLPLIEATNIQGTAMVLEKGGKELIIDLAKINFAYYHPLMKAIQKVDDEVVIGEIHKDKRKILFRKMNSQEIMFELNFTDS